MTDSQYEVAVLQASVKDLRLMTETVSNRVEKLLQLGPMVEELLLRTERLAQFVDAGLDRLAQEDHQARTEAPPAAAAVPAALPGSVEVPPAAASVPAALPDSVEVCPASACPRRIRCGCFTRPAGPSGRMFD